MASCLDRQLRVLATILSCSWPSPRRWADSKTVARCGQGFLEDVDGTKVLHLKGTPREMGLQHGTLLKDDIREEVRFLFDVKAKEFKPEV